MSGKHPATSTGNQPAEIDLEHRCQAGLKTT